MCQVYCVETLLNFTSWRQYDVFVERIQTLESDLVLNFENVDIKKKLVHRDQIQKIRLVSCRSKDC